jgi:hypothetical protein
MCNIAKLVELCFNIHVINTLGGFFTSAPEHVYFIKWIESAITPTFKPEKGLGGTINKRACYAKGNKK